MLIEEPSQELQALVRRKCNENIKTKDEDLRMIKEWLKKQPHLPDTWDDEMLIGFLRNCEFSLEKTKTKLDKYFTMKAALPEMFANRDLRRPEFQKILPLLHIGIMPHLTADGYRVHVAHIRASENEDFDFSLVPKAALMLADVYVKSETVAVAGDVFVVDASTVYLKYIVQITPALAKKFFTFVQDALAMKIKQFHIIRPSKVVDYFFQFLSPFMKEKIRKRIYFHQNLDSLFEYIPKEMLPEEFGGTAGKIEKYTDDVITAVEKYNSWLSQQEDIKADEAKRPGKPACTEELFGFDGSFKKLVID